VNKIIIFVFILFFATSCSLNSKSKFWTNEKKIQVEDDSRITEVFKKDEIYKNELNSNLKIKLSEKIIKKSFINNFNNNNGRTNYDGDLKKSSRFKFSKIDNFEYAEPEIVFDKDNLIFFDNKGSILKFTNSSKLVWKKNFYNKYEKKLKPLLSFANNNEVLLVTDNIAKFYAVNINSGELLWKKKNSSPFNSQIKIYKDRFFAVDINNVLRCYSIKDGNEIWQFRTEKSFIKSTKKLSLLIIDNKIIFNNSLGDISAVDIQTGNMIWQKPTQTSSIFEDTFSLMTSDLIGSKNVILLSNNKNEFYSLDIKDGSLNWKQKINSNLRPTLIGDLIFTITMEGFLVVINNKNGKVIRSTDILKKYKKKRKEKFKPIGFIVGVNNIYLTSNNGRLLVIDILTGRTSSILKIDNKKISRPFVLDQNLFIIEKSSIIKLN
jgi:outer membrane protein assembly factor BamB